MPRVWTTASPAQTKALGRQMARSLKAGDVLALCGDLGSGKTTFVQGVAQGLGVTEQVTSPTFVLVREYAGMLPVYHIDLFRLEAVDDLETIGWDEYVAGQGVTLIEWASKLRQRLPRDYLELTFEVIGARARSVTAVPHGSQASDT